MELFFVICCNRCRNIVYFRLMSAQYYMKYLVKVWNPFHTVSPNWCPGHY